MTSIVFEPTGGETQRSVGFGSTFNTTHGGDFCSWAVRINRDHRVRLATGGELKDVEAFVHLNVGTATPEGKRDYGRSKDQPDLKWGQFRYDKSWQSDFAGGPERVVIMLHPSRAVFDEIVQSTRIGNFPSVEINFENPSTQEGPKGFRTGWEPDGSGIDWDNKNHPRATVEGCDFLFRTSPRAVDDEGKPLPKMEELVAGGFKDIKAELKELRWAVWVAVGLALLSFWWRR